MNKELEEVNSMYQEVQPYIDPTVDELKSRSEVYQLELQTNNNKYGKVYSLAIEKLDLIFPRLSPNEIIEGYSEGCRLLQRSLSGYMANQFHSDYIPTMIDAVQRPDLHTAWIFLQALADNVGGDIFPLAVEALDTKELTETALNIVEQLNIVEALPKVKVLMSSEDDSIASLAAEIWSHLQRKGQIG